MSTVPAPFLVALSGKTNLTPMAHLLSFADSQGYDWACKQPADILVDLSRDPLTKDPAGLFLSLGTGLSPRPKGGGGGVQLNARLLREDQELIEITTALGSHWGRY